MVNSDMHWPYPSLFAHRGGGSLAPENTLAALKTGYMLGYQGVEFDVKLSRDGIAILMHDDTLERTTNGHGMVADVPYDKISQLDAGLWFGEAFRGEAVPRFSDMAAFLIDQKMMANVEIKPCPGRESETGTKVAAMCSELWQGQDLPPLISSFSVEALRAARAVSPQLPMGLLVESTPHDQLLLLLEELACVSIHFNYQVMTVEWVEYFHQHNYRVLLYTVNDINRARDLLAIGVDGLFTDKLDAMAAAFPSSLRSTD